MQSETESQIGINLIIDIEVKHDSGSFFFYQAYIFLCRGFAVFETLHRWLFSKAAGAQNMTSPCQTSLT